MAQTPEGKVKAEVKKILKEFNAYYFMPVQAGYGAPGLDFHCAAFGKAFFIETKAPGKKMTPRQLTTARIMRERGGAVVFKIDGEKGLGELREWLTTQQLQNKV